MPLLMDDERANAVASLPEKSSGRIGRGTCIIDVVPIFEIPEQDRS
jgi:hypothetical protein